MTKRPPYHYRMACGHQAHVYDVDDKPMCIFCNNRPQERKRVVAVLEKIGTRRGGKAREEWIPVEDLDGVRGERE